MTGHTTPYGEALEEATIRSILSVVNYDMRAYVEKDLRLLLERRTARFSPSAEGAPKPTDISSPSPALQEHLATRASRKSSAEACKHEPFEGRCVHCDARFVNGKVVSATAPTADEIHETLMVFRHELDKNMEVTHSSHSPGHDAMRVALHRLFSKRATADR